MCANSEIIWANLDQDVQRRSLRHVSIVGQNTAAKQEFDLLKINICVQFLSINLYYCFNYFICYSFYFNYILIIRVMMLNSKDTLNISLSKFHNFMKFKLIEVSIILR